MTPRPTCLSVAPHTGKQSNLGLAEPNVPHTTPFLQVPGHLIELIAQRAAELLADRQSAPALPPYLSVEEAADYLRCKPKRIYDLCSQRRLPFVKDGSRTLLRRADLDAYLETQT